MKGVKKEGKARIDKEKVIGEKTVKKREKTRKGWKGEKAEEKGIEHGIGGKESGTYY